MLQELIPGSTFVKGDVKLKDRKDAYDEINEGTNHGGYRYIWCCGCWD